MPAVSVIIPTYNRKEWLLEAIDSVLAQRGVSLECIVVDDGSTDGTCEALHARFGERIRYVYQENAGESVARNHGAELAEGEYLAFLDSDDVWLKDKLHHQLRTVESNPDAGFVACLASAMDEHGRPIWRLPYGYHIPGEVTLEYTLKNGLALSGSTQLFRRSVFEEMGGFAMHIRYGEDYDMSLRTLLAGKKILIVRKVLAVIRSHGSSQSLEMSEPKLLASMRDHLLICEEIEKKSDDPAVRLAIREKSNQLLARAAVHYIIMGREEQARQYLDQVTTQTGRSVDWYGLFDQQLAYFTPLIFRNHHASDAVQDTYNQVYDYRNTMVDEDRGKEDALQKLHAAVWCAEQGEWKEYLFAFSLVLKLIAKSPSLIVTPNFWKQILRLVFGRLAIRLFYLKEKVLNG